LSVTDTRAYTPFRRDADARPRPSEAGRHASPSRLANLTRRGSARRAPQRLDDLVDRITIDNRVAAGLVLLLLAATGCALAGLSPDLPAVVVLFVVAVVRPLAGLGYAMAVFAVPLGPHLIGLQGHLGQVFWGRDYVLSLSSTAIVFVLAAVAVARRRRVTRWRIAAAGAAVLVVVVWTAIGIANHGLAQSLVGVRLLMLPIAVLVAVAALPTRDVRRLMDLLSWFMVANAVAAIGEVLVGPARLARWGFPDGAIRYIGGTFRVPGLTEVNAELGMLAGAYLLGYLALWLAKGARPSGLSWHLGAVAGVVCLLLSTSRSGALMLVGGLLGVAVLSRSGSKARRRRYRLAGLLVVAGVAAAFVVLGATGSHSLGQRLDVWSSLLDRHAGLFGVGIGGVGAATFSRVGSGPQVFVDDYFLSVALQFGPLALVALAIAIVAAAVRLSRGSADDPAQVVYLAILTGLSCSFLVIESWEYRGAMMALAVFAVYARRLYPSPAGAARCDS
jgi:hypothetical protein